MPNDDEYDSEFMDEEPPRRAITGGLPHFSPEVARELQYALDNATPEDLAEGERLLEKQRAFEAAHTSSTGFPTSSFRGSGFSLDEGGGAPLPMPQVRQDFLQRGYGIIEKFNPETGRREVFTAVNPPGTRLPQFPIPRPQRDPMEEMRKTINAIQFQKANDAYKAALSFQAARAYRQDLDAGKSQGEALARWGHLLPGGLAGAARMTEASRPAFVPTPLPGSTNLYQVGPRGERLFQYRPPRPPVGEGPVTEIPVLNRDGTPNPDYFAVPSATGNGFVLHPKRGKEPTLTPQGQLKYYDNRIKALQTERANLGVDTEAEKRRTDLNKEITDLQTKQQELFEKYSKKGGKTETAAPNKLTREQAVEFLKQAGGDKEKARKLAKDAGYAF